MADDRRQSSGTGVRRIRRRHLEVASLEEYRKLRRAEELSQRPHLELPVPTDDEPDPPGAA